MLLLQWVCSWHICGAETITGECVIEINTVALLWSQTRANINILIISLAPILEVALLNIRNDNNPELFVFGTSISIISDYQLVILDSCGTRIEWASLEDTIRRDWYYDGELSCLVLVGYINL